MEKEKHKKLVVIASNGVQHSLRFIEKAGNKNPLLIVRTDLSEDRVEHEMITYTPYKCYDSGAYLWAYWNYPSNKYLFCQDSLIPRDENFADIFFEKLDDYPVVAWVSFPFPMWDSPWQEAAAKYHYGNINPSKGIFGPIFAVSKAALDILSSKQLLPMPPINKENAQGKEREWAMAFYKAGLDVHFIIDNWNGTREEMMYGNYPSFQKVFAGRS